MNEFKPKSIQYCNHFQEGKCRFGDKCKYEHKINPDYKKKDMDYDEKKKSNYFIPNKNNNNKFQYKKKFLLNKIIIIILMVVIEMTT